MKLLLIPIFAIIIVFSIAAYNKSTSIENKVPDIVFQGFVKDIQKQSDGNELVTFGVRHMEKGARINEITVVNVNTKKECSLNFKLSTSYIVYAVLVDGKYMTNSCLGTTVHILRDGSETVDHNVYPSPFERP